MEFRVLDENFNQVHILDDFKSAIWTDRFYEAGDFTIKLSLTGRNQFDPHRTICVELDVEPNHDDRKDCHRIFVR